jgi:hypothetical protein
VSGIPYEADVRIRMTPAQVAAWEIVPSGQVLIASGPCAACGDITKGEFAQQVTTSASSGEGRSLVPLDERATRQLICACTGDHPDRPTGITDGCGRYWLLTAVQDESPLGWGLSADVDETMAGAATALNVATRDELTAVRTSAEKWLPGVTALYGLFALSGVIFGKDALDGLADWARLLIAILTLAGLVAIAYAIYQGYRAAYGWPTTADVSTDEKLVAWFKARQRAPAIARVHLRNALIGACIALGCLFAAAGAIWFGPPASAPKTMAQIVYRQGGDAGMVVTDCGVVGSSDDGTAVQLTVKTASGSKKVSIPITWIDKQTFKASC